MSSVFSDFMDWCCGLAMHNLRTSLVQLVELYKSIHNSTIFRLPRFNLYKRYGSCFHNQSTGNFFQILSVNSWLYPLSTMPTIKTILNTYKELS